MQTIIVIVLVILAGLYVISRFWRARQGAPCCSDCSGCPCKGGASGPGGSGGSGGSARPGGPGGPFGTGLAPLKPEGGCPAGRTPKEGCPARLDQARGARGPAPDNTSK